MGERTDHADHGAVAVKHRNGQADPIVIRQADSSANLSAVVDHVGMGQRCPLGSACGAGGVLNAGCIAGFHRLSQALGLSRQSRSRVRPVIRLGTDAFGFQEVFPGQRTGLSDIAKMNQPSQLLLPGVDRASTADAIEVAKSGLEKQGFAA